MTKERPILFSGAMVRAILDGQKTQTRRALKPQPPAATTSVKVFHHPDPRPHFWANDGASLLDWAKPCPYGDVGDRLWVRETWQHSNHPFGPYEPGCMIFHRADYLDDPLGPDLERSPDGVRRDWRPSIHMPRSACRLELEVTGVRVERLNDCSEKDARAEGAICIDDITGRQVLFPNQCNAGSYRLGYQHLWNGINGAGAWKANPWVWVVEFRRIAP
ncbi:hypothetical protein [Ralstonia sp. NT80]|uniref:hypothetical protein n=1 Tax=Ralstonia sp. NT80 TaxID=1218247 RepID=UPI0009FA93FC|nr:hypothetical protein [Ralstonia sp. NT80]